MGNCGTTLTAEQKEALLANDKINEQLKVAKTALNKEVKLLLLGTGDSGKSTFAKQMKIIHLTGFTDEERNSMKKIIHINVITYMQLLLNHMRSFGYELKEENKPHGEFISNIPKDQLTANSVNFDEKVSSALIALWGDPAISQQTMSRYREFQLSDSATYFFRRLEKISKPDYLPQEADMLRARIQTTGIVEIQFTILEFNFKMVDVGGQRNERKKWIHCFDCVNAIIFVVALSEYDLYLEENPTVLRMHESLKLFNDIINNVWFQSTPIVLLLNKRDLFEEKIKTEDLNVCFPEYTGGKNFDNGVAFIKQKFIEKNKVLKTSLLVRSANSSLRTKDSLVLFIVINHLIQTGQ
eukprot:TRINITY_DN2577_c0_g1_i2.p1 TRINITY_DN2577_c0_g1~~TRINITY_DN2577_c0_g1_i2.p1  ORF type:complete len:354 (-),score=58.61 TRINITY_DN2577_c0_g1_i2:14-1075(-)